MAQVFVEGSEELRFWTGNHLGPGRYLQEGGHIGSERRASSAPYLMFTEMSTKSHLTLVLI